MNSSIQKRIEAIQRGETPKGYKKTKWGIMPDNWKEVHLGDVLTERKETKQNRELTICSVAVVKGIVDQIEHLGRSYAAADTSNYNVVKYGDIVYTKSPTGEFPYGIIKQSRINEDVAVSPLYGVFEPISFALGIILHCYFEYPINAYNYLAPIIQKGAKNTINITNQTFLSNYVILPPRPEQEKIAEILTQQDRLIDLLQKLIDEKRRQKKYLMQTLLTGRIRLPGFKDKWQTKTLGEILELRKTKIDPTSTKQNYPCIDLEHINGEKACLIGSSDSLQSLSVKTQFYKGDILFGKLRPYLRKIIIAPFDGVCCSEIWAFSVSNNTNNYFVFQYLRLDRIIAKANITTGTKMPRSDWDSFQNIAIPLPSLPEQEAIAEVLSTADEELSLLERELEQEKLRKKALMQLLLTGLVRVEEL